MLTKRIVFGGALLVLACGRTHSSPAPAPGPSVVPCDAHCLVTRDVRRLVHGWPKPDSSMITFHEEPSRYFGEVTYLWGEYNPAASAHARFVSVAAMTGDTVQIIREVEDFIAIAGTRLRPTTTEELLTVCAEWVYLFEPPRLPGIRPRVYDGPSSLDSLPLLVADLAGLRDSLDSGALPVTEGSAQSGWSATFWIIMPRDVNAYSCRVGESNVSLQVVDSLPGYGYFVR